MKIETLKEYCQRTTFMNWDPEGAEFTPHPQVEQKVNADGSYRPFRGDTTLFYLDQEAISALEAVQQSLYENKLVLSNPLNPLQFHMTLHDLDHTMGCDRRWDANRQAAEMILSELENGVVTLEPVRVFPMMNTSIVAGYRPAAERDCQTLMEWYRKLDQLFPSGQPTFHVTLAYFRHGSSGKMDMELLKRAISQANSMILPRLQFSKEQLVYQRFLDMDHYYSPMPETTPDGTANEQR